MRHITTLLILIFSTSIFAQNNVVKTAGVSYTAGAPTFSPGRTGSQVAIDTVTGYWYEYNGTSWSASGYRVQTISGCAAPAYTPAKYQSRLVINACTAGQGGPELYYYTGSAWLQINEGQTYTAGTGIAISGGNVISSTVVAGKDSTFALLNGEYTGKDINDNVYRNGTTGLRTIDTTGVLNISNGNSASSKIAVNIRPGGPYLTKIQKDALSDSPVTGDYHTGRSYSDSGSIAGENQVYNGGINYSPGGGHVNRYANAVGWGLEGNFKNAPSEKGEPGFGFYEMQWPEVVYSDTVQGTDGVKRATGVADNTKRRMIGGYASNQRPSYGGYFSVCTDQMPIVDWKTGTSKAVWTFAENMPNNKGITFIDTASLIFQKNNVGGLFYLNAAGNATLGCFKVDASNRMVLGFSGINTLYTEGQTFNSIGPLTIAPLASQPLTLGSTTTASVVQIKSIATVPVSFHSANNPTGWGHVVATYGFTLRDLATNADVINLDNACPDRSINVRGTTGNVGIGAYPDFDISLHVKKTALTAASKMIGMQNATGTSNIRRSDATPSAGAASDLTLASISGIGSAWVHDGTANRELAKVIKNTATLDFGSTAAGTSTDLTVTVTGASVGDPVGIGLPASPDANSCFTAWVSATNTVTVRFNNYQLLTAIDPASASYKVIVTKY